MNEWKKNPQKTNKNAEKLKHPTEESIHITINTKTATGIREHWAGFKLILRNSLSITISATSDLTERAKNMLYSKSRTSTEVLDLFITEP